MVLTSGFQDNLLVMKALETIDEAKGKNREKKERKKKGQGKKGRTEGLRKARRKFILFVSVSAIC